MKFGQLIECKGSFKKYVGRGGMKGSLKSERKRTVRGGSRLSERSLCEKIA